VNAAVIVMFCCLIGDPCSPPSPLQPVWCFRLFLLGVGCLQEYGVTFPITGKVGIKTNRHALYEFIADSFGEDALPIWNFHKVLIGRNGQVKGLFPASMAPNDPQIVTAIHRELESSEPRAEIA
jgi:glutathione peroxidase-family protein